MRKSTCIRVCINQLNALTGKLFYWKIIKLKKKMQKNCMLQKYGMVYFCEKWKYGWSGWMAITITIQLNSIESLYGRRSKVEAFEENCLATFGIFHFSFRENQQFAIDLCVQSICRFGNNRNWPFSVCMCCASAQVHNWLVAKFNGGKHWILFHFKRYWYNLCEHIQKPIHTVWMMIIILLLNE